MINSAGQYNLYKPLERRKVCILVDSRVQRGLGFIHRDPDMCNGLFNRTGAMPQVMHQTSTKNLAKAEFMLALGCAIARSTNIDAHLHVQGMLAELIEHVEFVRACIRASEADAAVNAAWGLMTPAEMPLWTVRMMFPKMFIRA